MTNYECKLCNYITKKQGNYNRHIKTSKHMEKVIEYDKCDKQIAIKIPIIRAQSSPTQVTTKSHPSICKYCNRDFSRPDTLAKHFKSCSDKHSVETRLEEQNKLLNIELKHYKEKSESKEEETNYYKQLLREAGGLVKKSVSALSYVATNYDDAPSIKTITLDGLTGSKDDEKKLIEDIISAYKHKTLGKYLGDIIIKIYKKEDPKDQSIWNTDDNRLTYLVKELIGNESIEKKSNWIVDKKGVKTQIYIIKPLLARIKELIITYQKNLIIPELVNNSVEIEFILENNKKIIELMNDIDDNNVAKDVLRCISSHLRFNSKLIE